MSKELTKAELDSLAQQANAAHARFVQTFGSAVEHAAQAGEYLNRAKASIKHGKWLTWLASNFEGSQQTANRYMQVAQITHMRVISGEESVRQLLLTAPKERKPRLRKSTWLKPDPDKAPAQTETNLPEATPPEPAAEPQPEASNKSVYQDFLAGVKPKQEAEMLLAQPALMEDVGKFRDWLNDVFGEVKVIEFHALLDRHSPTR